MKTTKHYYVAYIATVGRLTNVRCATKVYAESQELAEAKVLSLHSSITKVVQSYDLGD
jgi:hypothetical protein